MKNRILLIVFVLLSLSSAAQNNWSQISSSDIKLTSNNEDFTWFLYSNKAVKMNNKTKFREEFLLPSNLISPDFCLSFNDELWVVCQLGSSKIFHLKDGIWMNYSNSTSNNILTGGINKDDGTAVFGDPISSQILIIKNNMLKVINMSNTINFSNFCMPNSNSIVFYSSRSSAIFEIDTNGIIRNKFTYNRLGTTGSFKGYLEQDKNQNIYVLLNNDGLYKIRFASNDTSIQKLITNNQLTALSMEIFKVDYNNNIVIKSFHNNDKLYSIFNSSGSLLKSYNIINGTIASNYIFIGFDQNSYPLSVMKYREVWKVDDLDWNLIYKPINLYDGERVTISNIGNTNTLIFGGSNSLYTLSKDTVIKCSFDSTFLFDLNIVGISNVISGIQYLCINNGGVLKIAKCINSKVIFEDIVPNSSGNQNRINISNLIINSDSNLLVLMNNRINVYHGKNNPWTTIELNPTDNISEIYSFCNDDNGNIWVGTNKGVAKVVNNLIVLQSQINKNNEVHDIRYNKNENCLVFSNNTFSSNSICLYYLNTQNLITINTNYPTQKILIDQNNDYAYFQYDYDKIWRYDITNSTLDVNFNNNISNTPFNTIYPGNIEIDRDSRVYIFRRNNLAIEDHLIEIFDEKGFVSATHERNKFISFYPNPTYGLINLDSKQNYTNFHVYNTKGEILIQGKIENNKIDISELLPGVYTLKIIGVNGESFRKIIKN